MRVSWRKSHTWMLLRGSSIQPLKVAQKTRRLFSYLDMFLSEASFFHGVLTDEVIFFSFRESGRLTPVVISWFQTGNDLKQLRWHNYYHLSDAQTFLRLAESQVIMLTAPKTCSTVSRHVFHPTVKCGKKFPWLSARSISISGCLQASVWVAVTRKLLGGLQVTAVNEKWAGWWWQKAGGLTL